MVTRAWRDRYIFHYMDDLQFQQVSAALMNVFITETCPLLSGLNHPLGTVFKITGGIGIEMVLVEPLNLFNFREYP